MDTSLLERIDDALRRLEPMAAHAFGPALSIQRQLRWCRDRELGLPGGPPPGPLTMGLIATREFDMYGDQPELAMLINEIQRRVEATQGEPAAPSARRPGLRGRLRGRRAPWLCAVLAGGWGALSLALGVLLGSASIGAALLAAGAVLWLPLVATRRIGANSVRARRTWRTAEAACGVLTLVGAVSIAERIYLVRAERYPSWLTAGAFDAMSKDKILDLRRKECSGSMEIFEKRGMAIVRCGTLWLQPSTRTYVAPAGSLMHLIDANGTTARPGR